MLSWDSVYGRRPLACVLNNIPLDCGYFTFLETGSKACEFFIVTV